MTLNPSMIAKAMKMHVLRKQFEPAAMKIYESIVQSAANDGTFVYVFQAAFKLEAEAKAFMAFSALSAEMEKLLNEA